MDESVQTTPGAGRAFRRAAPPPALCGFLVLMAVVFAVSYVVGAAAGPVSPGMHGATTSGGGQHDGGGESGTQHGHGGSR
ncbi:hypothetical protein OIE54_04810 [Streptomyces sp. NBC_01794]|nr:hypothetical protein [Streptomyces sp. NBC_01750]WSB05264.1 hypothetical protein OIE54_04810 [Streptomyces sp. NBC_01794]WSD38012.1 hypothetical protein OG966_35810 [Streptomyces sp. NBC_01750]